MSDDSDLFNRIADSNVERVNRVANVMGRTGQRGIIGGRPDGTMEPSTTGMESLLRQIELHESNMRGEIEHLKAQLAREQGAREHLQEIIRQVADLIVNGSKGA